MNPIDNMSDVELILAVDNPVVDYDYRIEAAKEIYRRAGAMDESVNTTGTGPKR